MNKVSNFPAYAREAANIKYIGQKPKGFTGDKCNR
jgi:hypothetical protein